MKRTSSKPAKAKRNPPPTTYQLLPPAKAKAASRKRLLKLDNQLTANVPRKRWVMVPYAKFQAAAQSIAQVFQTESAGLTFQNQKDWRQQLVGIVEDALTTKDLTHWIDTLCGRDVAAVADAMVDRSQGTATLGHLATQLEIALVGVRWLINEHTADTLLTTPVE